MKLYPLFLSAIAGTQLISNQTTGCCPPNAMENPCEQCRQTQAKYNDLKSARSCIGCACTPQCYNAAIEMSLLVWEGREDGLNFAVKNNPRLAPSHGILLADVNGRMRKPHFSWNPAVKLNIEQMFTNSWDFDMRWTCFYSRSTASEHATIDQETTSGLFPLWILPQAYKADPNVYGKARGIWHLHLNTADLELGYHAFLTPKLSLRLHAGVKGVSISQQFTVRYSDGIDDGAFTLLSSRAAMRNRCLGAGPRFGFNSEWRLKKGWSILADGASAFTLCSFKLKRKDFDQMINSNLTFYDQESKFRESFYAFRPVFEGLLGFGWSTCYGCRKQYSFDFKGAYEVQYYPEQNMMRQLASEPISFSAFSMRGDLHCHGITTTLRFGF